MAVDSGGGLLLQVVDAAGPGAAAGAGEGLGVADDVVAVVDLTGDPEVAGLKDIHNHHHHLPHPPLLSPPHQALSPSWRG